MDWNGWISGYRAPYGAKKQIEEAVDPLNKFQFVGLRFSEGTKHAAASPPPPSLFQPDANISL